MNIPKNILQNNALTALSQKAAPRVLNAIKTASAKTGVDFAYLLEKAAAESGLRADIKSKTSSATGLFQFIEKTWLATVKAHGDKFGLGHLAAKIDARGNVSDPTVRKQILDLRKDPETASLMAAAFAGDNKEYLQQHYTGDIGSVELYLAHFLGAGGATAFLSAQQENPLANAADLFPRAARANHNVFYDSKTGEPRTLASVYDFFAKKFGGSGNSQTVQSNIKQAPVTPIRVQPPLPDMAAGPGQTPDLWAHSAAEAQRARLLDVLNTSENRGVAPGRTVMGTGFLMNPADVMLLAQLETPRESDRAARSRNQKPVYLRD